MKKLLSLVLICAMGFGMISCVESEESQSVAALRNAKAEQLKALTNLYNAQAEAALIVAEAEAAYNAALAAHQAELTAEAKEKYALELESLIAKYEANLMQYKFNKANYEKQLMDKLAEIEKAAEAELIALYTKYSTYTESLNSANTSLIQAKVNMARVEAEIVTVKEAAEIAIAEQEEIIAEQEAIIATEEAKLALYNNHAYADMNADSLAVEVAKANLAWRDAKTAYENNEAKAVTEAMKVAAKAANEMFKSAEEANFSSIDGSNVYVNDRNGVIHSTEKRYDESTGWVISEDGNRVSGAYINYYIKESALDAWKNKLATEDEYDYEGKVADAEEGLEKAEAALETMKGFEADFKKAAEARKAIVAYNEAYENYNDANETVKYLEAELESVKTNQDVEGRTAIVKRATTQKEFLEKVDLSKLTAEDMDEWDTSEWHIEYDLQQALDALKTNLTDLETKQAAEESAQDAVDALTDESTEAEVKAATDVLAAAQKAVKAAQDAVKAAYDKAVYEAGVILVQTTKSLNDAEQAIKDAEDAVTEAKENEKALLAAYPVAKSAIETLEAIFGEETEFDKFWCKREPGLYMFVNGFADYMKFGEVSEWSRGAVTFYVTLLADANEDNNPDLWLNNDGSVESGLYRTESVSYYDFATNYSAGSENYYEGVNYDFLVAHYTTKLAEAKDAVTSANNGMAKANEWKGNWDAKEKELRDFVAGLNDQIEDVQALQDAYRSAKDAAEKANDAVAELKGKFDAVNSLWALAKGEYSFNDGSETVAQLITNAENAIKTAENAIKNAESTIKTHEGKLDGTGSWNQSIPYKEALIAQYKAQIEKYTAEVELYTQLVENAKAALDAAISAQDAE